MPGSPGKFLSREAIFDIFQIMPARYSQSTDVSTEAEMPICLHVRPRDVDALFLKKVQLHLFSYLQEFSNHS